MPEISKFYGIIIYMYIDDHNPPHFHVWYDDYEAEITIKDGIVGELGTTDEQRSRKEDRTTSISESRENLISMPSEEVVEQSSTIKVIRRTRV